MPSREELLAGIKPGMKLTRAFFLRIYGDELTWPGFADTALAELEAAGCSKARPYYQRFVDEYEKKREKGLKRAAAWWKKECDKEFEETKRKRVNECREKRAEQRKNQGVSKGYVASLILKW